METEILFSERQKFKQWWLWIILLAINGLFIFGIIKQVIFGQQFGDKPMNNFMLIMVTVFVFLLTFSFISTRLETRIKKDGIYVKFFPFHLTFKYFPWDSLTKSYVREYSPLSEYGGWGIKYGLFGSGKVYNVSGNKGLQLEFKNHKKLLIGTKKAEEIEELLKNLGQIKL